MIRIENENKRTTLIPLTIIQLYQYFKVHKKYNTTSYLYSTLSNNKSYRIHSNYYLNLIFIVSSYYIH